MQGLAHSKYPRNSSLSHCRDVAPMTSGHLSALPFLQRTDEDTLVGGWPKVT